MGLQLKSESDNKKISLFLLAHQDDEFGVFQTIINEISEGHRVVCAFLTDGGKGRASTELRNNESLSVLQKIGVKKEDILFIGSKLSIPDGRLIDRFSDAAESINPFFKNLPLVSVYVPAWEGGHPDHDALHALVVTLADSYGAIDLVRQYPLYNGFRCRWKFFRVFRPIPLNGDVFMISIPWRHRFRFMGYCLSYRSQAKAWLGLFPFVAIHYVVSGLQFLQPVRIERIRQRPHEGVLYYEKRQFLSWEEMLVYLARLETTQFV